MSFWEFSIKIYQPESVRKACLTLQNSHGLDVNMVLFCFWYGITHGEINHDLFIKCHDFSRVWSENAVKPLRHARTWLKQSGCSHSHIQESSCMEYREKVKHIELEAEKLQQLSLEALCPANSTTSQNDDITKAIAINLKYYLDAENVTMADTVITVLETLASHSPVNIDCPLFRQSLANL